MNSAGYKGYVLFAVGGEDSQVSRRHEDSTRKAQLHRDNET